MTQKPVDKTELLLRRCDLSQCEGMCCYGGVFLEEGEEERIRAIVETYPDFFAFVPREICNSPCLLSLCRVAS